MFKKLLAILLACLLALPCGISLAAEALTCGDYEYTLNDDGTATITGYTGSETVLTVPEELDGHPVTAIGDSAFEYCKSLTDVVIPDGVTSIGVFAFSDCENLRSITLPDTLTSIDEFAFYDCENLRSITLPDTLTFIDEFAFYDCENLRSITLPDTLTFIGDSAFGYCGSLRSITIPDSVTSIGANPFQGCYNLSQISVSASHPTLTTIDGALFDKASKTLICYPCALTAESYSIPQGTLSIGDSAFFSCDSLTDVTIPDSVTSIGIDSFAFCNSLKSVTIPNSVTSIGSNPFFSCNQLTQLTVSPDHPTLEIIDGVLFDKTSRTLIFYPCISPAESYSVPQGTQAIADYAFFSCDDLTSVTFPDSLTSIGRQAFSYCPSLTSITISEGTASIDHMAFSGCESLTSVTIPASVTSINNFAFENCPSLTLTVPQGSYAEQYAVENDLPYVYSEKPDDQAAPTASSGYSYTLNDDGSATITGYTGSETVLTVPEELDGHRVTAIGERAFYRCEFLTSVMLPDGLISIGEGAFCRCSSLTETVIPDSLTSIGKWAFSWCVSLTSVSLPDSITYLGEEVFDACPSLTLTVPEGSYAESYAVENSLPYTY